MPAPGKALLNAMAISKSQDLQDAGEAEGALAEGAGARGVPPVLDAHGQVNDAA
jgi:hypothetical protein